MLTLCLPGVGIQDEEVAAIKMMIVENENENEARE
jgi:hypothetical protein